MIENNLSHKSGARSKLYKVEMNFFPLSLHICIHTDPFCFAVTWFPSATSMYLSVSSNDPGIKSVTSGVIWHNLSQIQNPIGQLRTVTILYTFAFVITRHLFHRCVYIMVVVIFTVVSYMITFFIKTYLLTPFLIISRWLGTFCDHAIFRSTYIVFPRRTFQIPVR